MHPSLSECGAVLNRVAIKGRRQGVYSAIVHIEAQGREIELDCRESDAVALGFARGFRFGFQKSFYR
jgi:bifunctional DNase/RNase